ncbi:GGDEF domain-containing protein [Orrella marina]|uniref:GGDEF domain-containing protein n=1 Tax=Orrella marina TaxID=2163011 RepID=A0A2R4XKB0_9BURK|nr:GGDEF domain-containing protein [Orrella marina]AWB34265.1 hypothetical protein DBV39_11730 [Orrella marina]
MVDLDRFKPINDRHGHTVGDEVLREVAKRIRATIRRSDTIGRFGGDEFVILLSEVDSPEGALTVASKIRDMLDSPVVVTKDLQVSVGACVGVAVYPEHGTTITELIGNADVAMYHAKETGGGRVQVFSEEILAAQLKKHAVIDLSNAVGAH